MIFWGFWICCKCIKLFVVDIPQNWPCTQSDFFVEVEALQVMVSGTSAGEATPRTCDILQWCLILLPDVSRWLRGANVQNAMILRIPKLAWLNTTSRNIEISSFSSSVGRAWVQCVQAPSRAWCDDLPCRPPSRPVSPKERFQLLLAVRMSYSAMLC